MNCYVVTFETHSDESRERVRTQLKTYPHFCPIHKYCWAILTDKKAKDIRNDVAAKLDKGERLFVIRSGTEAAWRNTFGDKNSEWLKENL